MFQDLYTGAAASFSRKESQVTRLCRLDYGQLRLFEADMLGYNTGVTAEGAIRRVIPERHWKYPWMFAVAVDVVEGQAFGGLAPGDAPGDANPNMNYDDVVVRVTYRGLLYDVVEDGVIAGGTENAPEMGRYLQRQPAPSVENLPLPYGAQKWCAAPKDLIQQNVPMTVSTWAWSFRWFSVPRVSFNNIRGCLGKVNDSAWDEGPRGIQAKKQTLLLTAAEIEHYKGPTGNDEFDITYHLISRDAGENADFPVERNGWNTLYRARPNTAGNVARYILVSADGTQTGKRIYEAVSFNNLFKLTNLVGS